MEVREDDVVLGDPGGGLTVDPRRWKALFVLALVQFMIIIDITVVNVALPSIQRSLRFTGDSLAWVVDGYALMAGGLLLLGGRLGDLFGRKRLFLIGTALKPLSEFNKDAVAWPHHPTLHNLTGSWSDAHLGPAMLHSIGPRHLHHAAFGRKAAPKNHQAAALLQRPMYRPYDLLT